MRLYVVGYGIYFLFDASLGIVFIEIFVPHLVEREQKFCEFVVDHHISDGGIFYGVA